MQNRDKKRILLIDDDMSLLATLSDFLNFEGYEVVTAESGEQGLRKLTLMTPDLIILDMSMPGIGGTGFLDEISSADGKPRYPVLVLTARSGMAEYFANVDVDGFVAKPCEPDDLLMEVGRILFLTSGGGKEEGRAASPEKARVLLGDDDVERRTRLVEAFAAEGYVVDSVGKGPEVLEKAVVERPEVVVMRLALARMSGKAVAGVLHEMQNTSTIPVVLYDATGSEGEREDLAPTVKRVLDSGEPKALLEAVAEVVRAV